MKFKNILRLLALILIGVILYSCQNEDDLLVESTESIQTIENTIPFGEKIILGEKLKNPYSIENMRHALNSLKSKNKFGRNIDFTIPKDFEIVTTHKYLKFIPKDSIELGIIEKDSSLIAYDYPLDYEILQIGDYYHDPEVPENRPTYHYASIKEGDPLPKGIDYEILSDLFIPDEEDISDTFVQLLVDESLILTNNSESDSDNRYMQSRASKWRPAGRIMVWDDNIGSTTTTIQVFSHWEYYNCGGSDGDGNDEIIMQRNLDITPSDDNPAQCRRPVYTTQTTTTPGSYIPMHGVKVRARRWFTTRTGITNEQGYYSCNGRFRRPANYKIKWKRHEFAIRRTGLSSAKYNGPKKKGDWNLNIRGGVQEYFATIFRAAHHYYYEDNKGLRRPPQNSFWNTQMKIRAFQQDGGSCGSGSNSIGCHTAFWRAFGLYSPVRIYTYERPSFETYATTIHELAHASHWNMDRWYFNNGTNTRVKESWARGVQWDLTRMIYPEYRGGGTSRDYTQVVVDMIDERAPLDEFGFPVDINNGTERLIQDDVEGYTIRQIEDALYKQKHWSAWRDNIINKYNNGTEENLDALFNFWDF